MSKPWKTTIDGTKPLLTVEERSDRRGQLYLLWWTDGKRRRPKLEGDHTVRGPDGTLDPERIETVRTAARLQYLRTQKGPVPTPRKSSTAPLDLVDGFDRMLAIPGGKYAHETARYRAVKLARGRILHVLGDRLLWQDLRPGHYLEVGRWFIRRFEAGDETLGFRVMEATVSALFAARNWLSAQEVIKGAAAAPEGWRAQLETEWQEAADRRSVSFEAKPHQPRHTPEETERLLDHLPHADPRLELALDLGAEYRLGQVARSHRRHLDLTPGAGAGHGILVVPGRGNKRGATIYLTPEQRATVDFALGPDGHLAHFEAAYQQGRLDDYPLFPRGKLAKGKCVLRQPLRRANRRTFLTFFHDLEDRAGVEQVPGRGWYGIRRVATDLARRHTTDEQVRDALGGWGGGSDVRSDVYMTRNHPDVLREAAEVRRKVRGVTVGAEPPPPDRSATAEAEDPATDPLPDSALAILESVLTHLNISRDQAARALLEASS
jgi:hypothetical protein